jgi:hypothetical protein
MSKYVEFHLKPIWAHVVSFVEYYEWAHQNICPILTNGPNNNSE